MYLIAHRGNLNGPNKETENTPQQITLCISKNYNCEIDVWVINNKWWLGHDGPQYEIQLSFIIDNCHMLWCHCKNLDAFQNLLKIKDVNCFYHNTDDYVLTSKGYIWCYPGKIIPNDNGIVVMPEWNYELKYDKNIVRGICTDYIENIDIFFYN